MRKLLTTAMAALMAVTSFATVSVSSAEAQPRHWRDGNHRHYDGPRYYPRHRHYPRDRYYHRRHHSGVGAAVAGGIIGLAAGSIIAGSAARATDSVAYCQQRFKSYDVRSGTYRGYDGRRHACP